MNSKLLIVCGMVSCLALWVQESDGLFFTTGTASGAATVGGVSAVNANTAVLLFGGLVVAKAVGFGILALLLVRV